MKRKQVLPLCLLSIQLTACSIDLTPLSVGSSVVAKEELFSVCSYNDSSMYYNTLSGKDREVYDLILSDLLSFNETTTVFDYGVDSVKHMYKSVLADHPEIFYLDGGRIGVHTLSDKRTMIEVRWQYYMTEDYAVAVNGKIEESLNEYKDLIKYTDSDYEKLSIACDFISDCTRYDKDAFNSQNIDSVFMWGETVCGGYAKAYKYLLNGVGIDCKYAVGYADDELHAWNIVYFNGDEYGVDVTWVDSGGGRKYFLMPIEEFNKTHIEDKTYICVTENELSSEMEVN